METSRRNVQAILFALIGFLFLNGGDSFLKKTSQFYETEFAGLVILTLEIALCVLCAFFWGGAKQITKPIKFKWHALRGIAMGICWLSFIIGMEYNHLSVNYSLLLSAPFWIGIIGFLFFRQRAGLHRWLSIIIGFVGVLIVVQPGSGIFAWTILLPLISAIAFATSVLATRPLEKETVINLAFYMLIGDLVIILPYLIYTGAWAPIDPNHLIYFFLSASLYLIGVYLTSRAFAIGDTASVGPTQYSQIIWGALIGYLFFAEIPEKWTLVGAAIIIASGVYLIIREHKAEKNT